MINGLTGTDITSYTVAFLSLDGVNDVGFTEDTSPLQDYKPDILVSGELIGSHNPVLYIVNGPWYGYFGPNNQWDLPTPTNGPWSKVLGGFGVTGPAVGPHGVIASDADINGYQY